MDEIKVYKQELPVRLRFAVGTWEFTVRLKGDGSIELVRTNALSDNQFRTFEVLTAEEDRALKASEWCRSCGDFENLDPASGYKWCRRCLEGNLLW